MCTNPPPPSPRTYFLSFPGTRDPLLASSHPSTLKSKPYRESATVVSFSHAGHIAHATNRSLCEGGPGGLEAGEARHHQGVALGHILRFYGLRRLSCLRGLKMIFKNQVQVPVTFLVQCRETHRSVWFRLEIWSVWVQSWSGYRLVQDWLQSWLVWLQSLLFGRSGSRAGRSGSRAVRSVCRAVRSVMVTEMILLFLC